MRGRYISIIATPGNPSVFTRQDKEVLMKIFCVHPDRSLSFYISSFRSVLSLDGLEIFEQICLNLGRVFVEYSLEVFD